MLAVARRKLIRPNAFAFPGTKPGFNPSHLAAAKTSFSAIALLNGPVNLMTGAKGTITGTPTFSVDALLGPRLAAATAIDGANWPIGAKNDTDFTFAAIYSVPVTGQSPVIVSLGNADGAVLRNNLGVPEIRITGTVSLSNGFAAVAAGATYFYAASASHDSGSWNHNHVFVDLRTGKTLISSVTGTVGGTTAATTCYAIASPPAGGNNSISVAAGMYSASFTPLATLAAWAADPWTFWYPR